MASRKVKTLVRTLTYTAVYATGTLTVTTASAHNLASTNLVTLINANSPQELVNVAVTVTGANTFTVADTRAIDFTSGIVSIGYYSAGQTGDQSVFTIAKSINAPTVIQFTAVGTGGASLTVLVSNDGQGWIPVASVTLAATTLATDFISIAPNWTQAKVNITSIGAATSVIATVAA